MKKALLIMSMLLVAGLAAEITLNDAIKTASSMKKIGENTMIKPQHQVEAGNDLYWPIELLSSTEQIVTIVPVRISDGGVGQGEFAKDVQKTHYLANFFVNNPGIKDYVGGTQGSAGSLQAQLEDKKSNIESEVKPSLSARGISLTNLPAYESALSSAISSARSIRSAAPELTAAMGSINKIGDIGTVQNRFNAFFAHGQSLITSLSSLKSSADAMRVEISQMTEGEADETKKLYLMTLADQFSISGLSSIIISMEDDVKENKDTINQFFSDIGPKTDEYYRVLLQRIAEMENDTLKQRAWAVYGNLTLRYNSLAEKQGTLNPSYGEDMDAARSSLALLSQQIEGGSLAEADETIGEIEKTLSELEANVGKWPPTCTGGKVFYNSACVCPAGTEETASGCQAIKKEGGPNLTAIGGMLAVIAVLALFYHFYQGRGDGAEGEEPKPTWSSYKFS